MIYLLLFLAQLVHAQLPYQNSDHASYQNEEFLYQELRRSGLDGSGCIDSPTFCIDRTNSRIGITTTTPAYKLDVTVGSNSDGLMIRTNGAKNILLAGHANGGFLELYDNTATRNVLISAQSNDITYFNNGGNVGISSAIPVTKLGITGGITATSSATIASLYIGTTVARGYAASIAQNWNVTMTTNNATMVLDSVGQPTNNTANNQRSEALRIKHTLNSTAGVNTTASVGIFVEARGGDSNYAILTQGGNVGINTIAPDQALDVAGTISQSNQLSCSTGLTTDADGDINGCVASDRKLKKNIIPFPYNPVIDELKPKLYQWKSKDRGDTRVHAGFIAQDVKKVFPYAVVQAGGEYLGIDPNALNALLVLEIQHLRKRIEALEKNELANR